MRHLVSMSRWIGIAGLLFTLLLAPAAAAQDASPPAPGGSRDPTYEGPRNPGPPPDVGAVVFEDPLLERGVMWPGLCPTKRNVREFVGEGTIVKITGRCFESSTFASYSFQLLPLDVADGEVRIEFKAVSGQDRGLFRLWLRHQGRDDAQQYYLLTVAPGRGTAELYRRAEGRGETLAERADLGGLLARDGWNSLAVRLKGPGIWVLLNDELALAVQDSALSSGSLHVGVTRSGGLDDQPESAVVMRNLRVSALAAPDARRPAYVSPPEPGDAIIAEPLTASGAVRSGVCPTQRAENRFVPDGFLMRVAGKCRDEASSAQITETIAGLVLPDGELRVETRAVAAPERALFRVFFRAQPNSTDGYIVYVAPTRGWVGLQRWSGTESTYLGGLSDATPLFSPDGWNSLAIRLQGSTIWVLVNDLPVLRATDPAYSSGTVELNLERLGDLNDERETAVVVRNLQVSRLAR